MKMFRSIKWRATTAFLFILLFILCLVVGFSYVQLTRAVYSNEGVVSNVYTTNIDIPSGVGEVPVLNYKSLFNYTIPASRLDAIRDESVTTIGIQTKLGLLSLDQGQFISDETEGDQSIWIYYRLSPVDPSKFEIMVMMRPLAETRSVLGKFTNVLVIALPVVLVLAVLSGFLLVRRLLHPINKITETVNKISAENSFQEIESPSSTELTELTRGLNLALARLHEVVERKQKLIADTSHELRTPLTVLQGEATLALRKQRTTEEYEKYLQTIARESSNLSSMVNKLSLLSKLEGNRDKTDLAPLDLTRLLGDVSPGLEILCSNEGLKFDVQLDKDIRVFGDEFKLRELILNLAENAVKYNSPGGSVNFSLSNRNGNAIIQVSDTGIGIEQQHLSRIFERYYRVETSRVRNRDGTGLGLYLCHKIVELHGGRIGVESEPGKGSIFRVYLPLKSN